MKRHLREFINWCLSPFNLKIMHDPDEVITCNNLFDDLKIMVKHDSPICLDVGANEGQTIDSLLKVFGNPFIYAFEPSTHIFKKLQAIIIVIRFPYKPVQVNES